MARETLYNKVLSRLSLTVALRSANATVNGTTVDRADPLGGYDGFNSAMAVVVTGTITDGTHTVVLQDSDDGSSWAAAAAGDIQGAAAVTAADDNTVFEIGYTGTKRYLRLSVTSAGVTTGGTFGGVIVLGDPSREPVQR
jgi:hypothetical protein